MPIAAGAGGLGGFLLRYVASLALDDRPLLAPVSEQAGHCPTLLFLLEEFIATHQLGVLTLLLAFSAGSGFTLGCIVGFSWAAGRCFATGLHRLSTRSRRDLSPHPRIAGYSPQ